MIRFTVVSLWTSRKLLLALGVCGLALGERGAAMGELAPLLERVMSSFGQPATMAEKWAAELTKAWVTTVELEDAAQLLALEREEKRNGVTKLSEGWRTIIKTVTM